MITKFNVLTEKICKQLDKAAGLCIAAVMFLVVANILLREIFSRPILGTYELVGLLTALGIGLALAHCAWQQGHIAVGFVMDRLPLKLQAGFDLLTNLLTLGFWSLTAWQLCRYAASMAANGVVSATARIPVYPVLYLLALGFLVLVLVQVVRVTEAARILFPGVFSAGLRPLSELTGSARKAIR
jgi:TRAP-type C4-dicarboxylate transport system permease small subunit